jgi:hypothetical protein
MFVFDSRSLLRSIALRALPWLLAVALSVGLSLYLF